MSSQPTAGAEGCRPFVSVIIPTHNRASFVVRAVEALRRQDYPRDCYEVIVSCDRCADGTPELLAQRFGDAVRVIVSDAPGQTGAINFALRHARGEIGIFLDDEIEASPILVSEHVRSHQAEPDPNIGVTGYCELALDARSTPLARRMAGWYKQFFEEFASPEHQNTPRDLCGSNFSLRLDALHDAGGFNESFFFARNDFELAARLLERGFQFRFSRQAWGRMHWAETTDLMVRRATEWGRADARLARDFPWCVPHLPFHSALRKRRSRWKWLWLWRLRVFALPLLRALHSLRRGQLRLYTWDYNARYFTAVRAEFSSWKELDRTCGIA
jgi:glycosyltransferase involved in cell wall biosynthesis